MKTWMKILIATIGSGICGGLTYWASINPTWGQVFCYLSLATAGAMSVLISWPPRKEA